jgi:hypothetical protein
MNKFDATGGIFALRMETAFGIVPDREQQEMLSYLQRCAGVQNCQIRKLGEEEAVDASLFTLLVNSPYIVYERRDCTVIDVIRKAMHWPPGTFIVGIEAVSAYLEFYTTYVCECTNVRDFF